MLTHYELRFDYYRVEIRLQNSALFWFRYIQANYIPRGVP
jgi:hypothetical protein